MLLLIVDRGLLGGLRSIAVSAASETNNAVASTAVRPSSSTCCSGSPQSLVSWDSLGREGRSFVSGGPSLSELRAVTGGPVKAPIRVYVGLATRPSLDESAALAVRELDRTDAASRGILCVVTSTGTGWIDPFAAAALEVRGRWRHRAGQHPVLLPAELDHVPR